MSDRRRPQVWWQVYPLGFVGAPPEAAENEPVVHRLRHLVGWLDYAVELGADGLALGPVFASHTHGYDTVDHFRIDPRLGDDADFEALVEAAHGRGLQVLLDGVFNHVGRGFPAFAEVLATGPQAAGAEWFRLSWPSAWRPGSEPEYETFEGHGQLVALNHAEPAVAEHVTAVMNHWLDRGADGWRLDAAYAVPTEFWRRVLPRVRREHPDAYIVGEVIHGDYPTVVRESGMDSVTQYELWKALWSSLNDVNLFELAHALTRHNGFCESFVPWTFVGNHDVTRLASRLHDSRHLAHALVVLFTVGGTPCVWSGDEQAFHGIKEDRPGGDDEIRPAFPAGPADLAEYGWPVYRLHQDLIGLRHRNPWLSTALTEVFELRNEVLAYRVHVPGESAGLLVLLNLGDEPFRPILPEEPAPAVGEPRILLRSGRDLPPGEVEPHGWAILAL
ncbi:MAG: cyclomaltodextrinase / maltogenic alpha-amylase / neopullulanase [Actinomycetota bacterium]|nr:cyclomaltodextrinase / maltogenic alpha-amylase / neopullulanase [Actinomycetota bacterium]